MLKVKSLKLKYKFSISILTGAIIIIALVATFCFFGELNPVIAAVGGLLFSVPIRLFWQSYMMPVLKIKGVEYRIFRLKDWEYIANRIIIENNGRSAAKNCKGYIVVEEAKERVCWTVPRERPNASINKKDDERLDFCAFYKSGPTHYGPIVVGQKQKEVPRVIAPTEEGWQPAPSDCRKLDEMKECKVLITADNAEPVDALIRFNPQKREIEIIGN